MRGPDGKSLILFLTVAGSARTHAPVRRRTFTFLFFIFYFYIKYNYARALASFPESARAREREREEKYGWEKKKKNVTLYYQDVSSEPVYRADVTRRQQRVRVSIFNGPDRATPPPTPETGKQCAGRRVHGRPFRFRRVVGYRVGCACVRASERAKNQPRAGARVPVTTRGPPERPAPPPARAKRGRRSETKTETERWTQIRPPRARHGST